MLFSGDQGPPGVLPSSMLTASINDQLSSDTTVCIIILKWWIILYYVLGKKQSYITYFLGNFNIINSHYNTYSNCSHCRVCPNPHWTIDKHYYANITLDWSGLLNTRVLERPIVIILNYHPLMILPILLLVLQIMLVME